MQSTSGMKRAPPYRCTFETYACTCRHVPVEVNHHHHDVDHDGGNNYRVKIFVLHEIVELQAPFLPDQMRTEGVSHTYIHTYIL